MTKIKRKSLRLLTDAQQNAFMADACAEKVLANDIEPVIVYIRNDALRLLHVYEALYRHGRAPAHAFLMTYKQRRMQWKTVNDKEKRHDIVP